MSSNMIICKDVALVKENLVSKQSQWKSLLEDKVPEKI